MPGPTAFVLGLTHAGLAGVRSLGRAGVPVVSIDADHREVGAASRYGIFRQCPAFERSDDVLRFLIEQGRQLGQPGVLILARDDLVELVANHQEDLRPYFRFPVFSELARQASVDKRRQYEAAEALGVPFPPTFFPETMEEVLDIRDQIDYPAFIKPRHSHRWRRSFKCKGVVAHNRRELVDGFEEALRAGLETVIQQVVPGPDTNVYALWTYINQEDQPLAAVTVQKLRQWPVRFGVGCLVMSVEQPEVAELALRFCRGLGFRGIAEVEFKRDERDGVYRLMELNPRLGSYAQLAIDCGPNLPLMEYLDLAGQGPEPHLHYRTGVRWLDPLYDVRSFRWSLCHERLSPWSWLKSLRGVSSYSSFARDDLGPFRRDIANLARAACRKAFASSRAH
jgi:predicted ATP-grasp superfamily ATP-dependent carboligase